MHLAHHGAYQPFDVSSKARWSNRTVQQCNAVFGAASPQRFAMKFRAIVDVDIQRQTVHVP
jgi:hypothetical protein